MNEKEKAARLSIYSNAFLIVIKLFVALLGGSVGIISEAIHSMVDILASFMAFFSVRISSKPPDEGHPYGHGKYENVSGVIEAMLILGAAVWIIYEAVKRFLYPHPTKYALYGFLVMLISMLVNIFVSRKLYAVARKYDSVALEADALHLRTDIYTSAGVALGFGLLYLTSYVWIDPLIAFLVALLIIYEAVMLIKQAFSPLVDTRLPKEESELIRHLLEDKINSLPGTSYKQLRTRKSGSHKYVDFILIVPGEISVSMAHLICDQLEESIRNEISNVDINIHIEPHKPDNIIPPAHS